MQHPEQDVMSQMATQKSNHPSSTGRPGLSDLTFWASQSQSRPKTMSSVTIGKGPAYENSATSSTGPPQRHASKASATSSGSIVKRRSGLTATNPRDKRQRQKSVRFAFDIESNEAAAEEMVDTGKLSLRLASPPPPATRDTSPLQQDSLSSSAGKASSQSIEMRATLAEAANSNNTSDIIKPSHQRPQLKARPLAKHQALTMANLATLPDQSKNGGRHSDGLWEDEDDTASNTDFELAVRMERRWI